MVIVHQVAGDIHAQDAQLGAEPFRVVEVGQADGAGPVSAVERQLPARSTAGSRAPLGAVQFGQV